MLKSGEEKLLIEGVIDLNEFINVINHFLDSCFILS